MKSDSEFTSPYSTFWNHAIRNTKYGLFSTLCMICTGTISIGNPKEPSYLQSVELKNSKPEELRILEGYNVGNEFGP